MIEFTLNGQKIKTNADPSTPLLWVLRDDLQKTDTKFGCGISMCGACTIHLNGQAVRSCVTPISAAAGQSVTTIAGLEDKIGQAVQNAWQKLNVVQCGYCQSGQIMSAVALLKTNSSPSEAQIDEAMSGNICRCATYQRIKQAIQLAAKEVSHA